MSKKTIKPTMTNGQTISECATSDHARAKFIQTVAKRSASLDTFLSVVDAVRTTKASFTFNDFVAMSKPYDLDFIELRRLYNLWTKTLLDLNRLTSVPSVYDEQIFCFV